MSSADCTLLVQVMQQAAKGVIYAEKPFAYLQGTVSGTDPLKIRVDQKLELVEEQLILTNAVRDHHVFLEAYDNEKAYDDGGAGHHVSEIQNQDHSHEIQNVPVDTTVTITAPQPGAGTGTGFANGRTEDQSQETDHDHNYKGGVFKFKLGLKKDEKVHLLQVDGGQHFIVLDRVDPPTGKEGSD